jgi:hypothetical protein
MPRDTVFNKSWLASDVKDNNGDIVCDWCTSVAQNCTSAFCKVCRKTVSVANMGFSQLLAHADGEKHISNMKALQGQALFTVVRPSADGKSVVASSDPGPDNSTQQNNTPAVAISYIMFDSLEIKQLC